MEQSAKLLLFIAGTIAQGYVVKNCWCVFLGAESVKALCGKQIMPYLLNKAVLAKSVSQNPS